MIKHRSFHNRKRLIVMSPVHLVLDNNYFNVKSADDIGNQ